MAISVLDAGGVAMNRRSVLTIGVATTVWLAGLGLTISAQDNTR
jgi:hypothetical protein